MDLQSMTTEEAINEDLIGIKEEVERLKRNSPSTTTVAYDVALEGLGRVMQAIAEADIIKKGVPAHKVLVGRAVVGGNASLVEAESWRSVLSARFPEEKITIIDPYRAVDGYPV